MPLAAEPTITFAGTVECQVTVTPAALLLQGHAPPAAAETGDPLEVVLAGAAAPGIPPRLDGARIDQPAPGQARIVSGPLQRTVSVRAVHVHRDVGVAFRVAIPARPAPWSKRLFWRLVLTMARSSPGLALLTALRRSS